MRAALAVVLLVFSLYAVIEARVRIDITSPLGTFPIAVSELDGPYGKELSETITEDLAYTGLFRPIERAAFIETSDAPFNPGNWRPLGAEAVLKGSVKSNGKEITVTVSLYDLSEGAAILRKEYTADAALIRPIAHSIANDIHQRLTGQRGVFRSRIAFVAEEDGQKRLCLMDWDGGRIKRLGPAGAVLLTPHWSKDGMRLVYSARRGGLWGIHILDLGSMKEFLTAHSSKSTLMAGDFFPDSDAFAFSSSEGGSPDIYIYRLSGGQSNRLTSSSGIEVSPSVSPDGKTIAFVSDMGGSPQLYTMDGNGYNTKRITFEGAYNTSPSWSPKGDMIAFVGNMRGKNRIFAVAPDGSGLTGLTDKGNNEDPSFSPDGRFIVFSSDRDGERGIYIMRANGEGQRRLTPKGLKASGPRWSPE